MILLPMLLVLQIAAPKHAPPPKPVGPPAPDAERYAHCVDLAERDPVKGAQEADRWIAGGGTFLALQCRGLAFANGQRPVDAAADFEGAAKSAEMAQDVRAGTYWAQAGNAWLAANEPVKARNALDAALASGNLTGLQKGEAELDRARALVAQKQMTEARETIDRALADAPADPLAWLLSATLARRMQDTPRAQKDIDQALRLAATDPSVQLEAGNIAATARDEDGAKAAWTRVTQLAPNSDQARAAKDALAQFDEPAAAAKP